MKLNGKDEDRVVRVTCDTGGLLVVERSRYTALALGRGRYKWDEYKVFLTRSEVEKLYKFMQDNPS
jgi:hypothetical protein